MAEMTLTLGIPAPSTCAGLGCIVSVSVHSAVSERKIRNIFIVAYHHTLLQQHFNLGCAHSGCVCITSSAEQQG